MGDMLSGGYLDMGISRVFEHCGHVGVMGIARWLAGDLRRIHTIVSILELQGGSSFWGVRSTVHCSTLPCFLAASKYLMGSPTTAL